MPHKALAMILAWTLAPVAHSVEVTHGTSSGDVTATSAIIWARCDQKAEVVVDIQPALGLAKTLQFSSKARAEDDFTARVPAQGLTPATLYRYDVRCKAKRRKSLPVSGICRTAPRPEDNASLTLLWSCDLAGQRYCRRPGVGYQIVGPMADHHADFVGTHGMIC